MTRRADRVMVPAALLKLIEEYLGDQPQRDERAQDLHERIVKLMIAAGLL